MVRTPSCDKNGMKKGTWTPEEDRKLVAYVTRYGCWNWRQLPKFAGLKRCGKSCRLRWMNYLRPNLKRGNYSNEEEEIIIKLHQSLGNKWSAIAAQLPGRTDNEVKNHWHTHLKKRVGPQQESQPSDKESDSSDSSIMISSTSDHHDHDDLDSDDHQGNINPAVLVLAPQILDGVSSYPSTIMSPQPSPSSSDEASTLTTESTNSATEIISSTDKNDLIAESNLVSSVINYSAVNINPFDAFSQFSDDFWTEPFLADNSYVHASDPLLAAALTGTEFLSPEFDANYLLFPDENLYLQEHVQV